MTKTVLKLTFKDKPNIRYYFRGCKAIFKAYTEEELGCVLGTAWNKIYKGRYENKQIIIEKVPIIKAAVVENNQILELDLKQPYCIGICSD